MNAEERLAQRIESLSKMFTDAEPASLRAGYLADPSAGRPVLKGSTATALVPRWNEHSSGLLVPATVQPPAPLDLGAAYLTCDEIFGVALPADYAVRQLGRLPLEGVIRFCAQVLNALALPGGSVEAIEAHFAGQWLEEPVRSRVRNLLRDESRRLLVPQAFMLLARMALEISPDTLPDDLSDVDIVGALFSLTQTMGRLPGIGPSVITDKPGTLGRELIANQHFHRSWSVPGVLARYARRWLQLPSEHHGEPGIVDLSQTYQDCTGARLEDLAAVAGYLWLCTTMGRFVIEPGELAGLAMPAERVEAVLTLITNDLPGMREAVRRERPGQRTQWSFDPFQQWPVIRLPENRLLILDPRHLISRAFGWLPIWDIEFPPPGRTKPAGHRKTVARAKQTLRHCSEIYVSEVLHAITRDEGTTRRVYDDTELKTAYTAQGQRRADAAIDYPGTWIVIEVTTTQLRRDAATAVPGESQIQDIDKLVDELDQIDATINALRGDETALTGAPAADDRRFLPLLVLPEGFPVNPITLTVIRERARNRGLFTRPDTDPVEIVDVEELEMIEALQEASGPSLLDILRGKQSGSLRNAAVRDHILHVLRVHPDAPARHGGLLDSALKPLVNALPQHHRSSPAS
ncbi:hypothetical protein [Streptomyces sp. NBC_00687]|uniref:hypothetical protein n=1 Tax=Streptomyces sp. NBC_00687 TaxID=2975807 RepID=UPI002250D45B|nr:hypothetical protein [Streptomyces sp. NBC_00687]MCX4920095.1 hypothetical protein [Streptomyces sp. NBC_00687]